MQLHAPCGTRAELVDVVRIRRWCVLEHLFVYRHHVTVLDGVVAQRLPGQGMQLLADAQKFSKRHQGVDHVAGNLVDYQVIYFADTLAGLIEDCGARHAAADDQFVGRKLVSHDGLLRLSIGNKKLMHKPLSGLGYVFGFALLHGRRRVVQLFFVHRLVHGLGRTFEFGGFLFATLCRKRGTGGHLLGFGFRGRLNTS